MAGLDITLTTTSPKGILTLVFLLDSGNSYSPETNENLISKFFLLQIRTRQKSNEIILFLEFSRSILVSWLPHVNPLYKEFPLTHFFGMLEKSMLLETRLNGL